MYPSSHEIRDAEPIFQVRFSCDQECPPLHPASTPFGRADGGRALHDPCRRGTSLNRALVAECEAHAARFLDMAVDGRSNPLVRRTVHADQKLVLEAHAMD